MAALRLCDSDLELSSGSPSLLSTSFLATKNLSGALPTKSAVSREDRSAALVLNKWKGLVLKHLNSLVVASASL